MQDPSIIKILQKQGEINDELDYAIMNYLLQNRFPKDILIKLLIRFQMQY